MTQAIAKYAAKKMLSSEMNKYKDKAPVGQYDPFYEEIPHPTKPGKMKKVKKQVPAYIPEHDANILARARKTAYRLDCCLFNFLGIRFGWSSVIGIVPAAGDGIDAAFALKLIYSMGKIEGGLPGGIMFMMLLNMVFDFLVGLIPLVGDLIDAGYKVNSKNVRLLEEHLDKKYKPKQLIEQENAEAKANKNYKRPRPASVYVDFSDEEEDHHNIYNDRRDDVRQPPPAYSGRRDRVPDEEMGLPRQDTHKSRNDKPSRHNTKSSRR